MNNIDFFIRKFRELLDLRDDSKAIPDYYLPRVYRNSAVQFRKSSFEDFEYRMKKLEEVGLNVFFFHAKDIPGCDLLSDSGTSTMTMEQWAQILLGDEAYGSNEGYFVLHKQLIEIFGPGWSIKTDKKTEIDNLFLFHQGRPAENALFSAFAKFVNKKDNEKIVIPSNSHFDTTEANIDDKGIQPVNLPCSEHLNDDESFYFRGNMDIEKLNNLVNDPGNNVPVVYISITNNTGGGQPVSMENIRNVSEICHSREIPVFFDACRFAENSWFIQKYEEGYSNKKIIEIIHEMFRYVDGFHISFKKDGLVNIGGGIIIKQDGLIPTLYPEFINILTDHQILTEGHPTYGGMAGRDLMGLAQGLKTIINQEYLDHRISQVKRFGNKLKQYNIPVIFPIGGHAVYLKVDEFFEIVDFSTDDFKGISLTALLLIAGHRMCELGSYAFSKYDNKNDTFIPPNPRVNFVRGAIPRLTYEDQDLYAVAEALRILHDNKDRIPGVNIEYGRDLSLKHFKSKFSFKK